VKPVLLQEVSNMFSKKTIAMLIALTAVTAFVLPASAGYFGGSSDGQVPGGKLSADGNCRYQYTDGECACNGNFQYQYSNGECACDGYCLYNGEGPQDGTGFKHGQQNKRMNGNSMNCGNCPYLNQ
jgi:hypothetical protein